MKFTIYQESRIGRRRANQDRIAYSYSRDALLLVIADGMGGHLHGEVAAQIAVQYITDTFQAEAAPTIDDPVLFLSKILNNAHYAIVDYAGDRLLEEAPRTTCVVCLVQDNVAFWAHAGDSRLYLIRGGRVAALTRDHSRVRMMVEDGLISESEAAVHPARNRIFSCLGGNRTPQIEFSPRTPLLAGDVIVLATDGAWGPLGAERLIGGLDGATVMESVPRLLDLAEELEESYAGDTSGLVSTVTMPLDGFTTQMEGFSRVRDAGVPPGDLSDEEIERAIEEIQTAIRKYSK
ncbi:MAG: serine/threonine protein phosphatase [Proteobacteria bacterium]|nr:serine/threonine protein phosphatase [Pseudomonadota bacterium]